ncbi:Uncharacterized protein Y057_5063 [Fusarium fujikuroi]|nr:Uncharacterized protein Y057_5063 [Fusarium fujikuroi]QGI87171.1 hypothetical protein CEK25_002127 [Fusarium fujikuroi]
MLTKVHFSVVISLVHGALALSMGYPLCTTEPALSLEAGKSSLSANVHSSMEQRCEATLHFSDPSFLPIRYSFDDELECDGKQVLAFTIPKGSPNGDVDIIWQCTGLAPSCSHGVIFGGSADLSIASESTGDVGCLMETAVTRTAPITITRSSATFVEMAPTVVVTSTTSFLRKTKNRTTFETHHTRTKTKPGFDESETSGVPYSDIESTATGLSTTIPSSDIPSTATGLGTTTNDSKEPSTTNDIRTGPVSTDSDTFPISSPTLALEVPQNAAETTIKPTDDGVFMSDATKPTIPILPAVTASIISTLTLSDELISLIARISLLSHIATAMSNKGLPALRPPGSGNRTLAPVFSPISAGGYQSPIYCQSCAAHRDGEGLKKIDDKIDAVLRQLEDLKQDLIASTTLTAMGNKTSNCLTPKPCSSFSPGTPRPMYNWPDSDVRSMDETNSSEL